MKPVTKKILQKVVGSYPVADHPQYPTIPMIEWSDEDSCFSTIDFELLNDISWRLGGGYPTFSYVHEDLQSLKLPLWMYLRSPRLTFNRLREMWIEVQIAHRVAEVKWRHLEMLRKVRNKRAKHK